MPHGQSTWIPPQGPVASPVSRTSEPRSVAILSQKIALICCASILILLGPSRSRVLLRPALLVLGSLVGRFPPADELPRPCLASRMLGWPPLPLACSFAATWPAFALFSLEHLLPWSLTGHSIGLRPLSLHHLRVAVLIPVQICVVSRPAAVIASKFR